MLREQYLVELTGKQISKKQDRPRLLRTKTVRVWYYGIRETTQKKFLTIFFKALDSKGSGRKHLVRIVCEDYPTYLKENPNISQIDLVKKSLTEGNIRIHCGCEDYAFRFSYMADSRKYGIVKEPRFPHVTNPELKGSCCKHCLSVLNRAPLFLKSFSLDLANKNFKANVRIKSGNKIYVI